MEGNVNRKDLENVQIKLPIETIAAIMDFGIAELSVITRIETDPVPAGVSLGELAAQQLIAGEAVRLYEYGDLPGAPAVKCHSLTLRKLMDGVRRYLEAGFWFLLEDDGTLNAEFLEPDDTVPILTMAMIALDPDEKDGT